MALVLAVLALPIWLQMVGFFIAVIFMRYRLVLFIPAVFSDVLYRATGSFSFEYIKMTLVVVGLLLLYWFVTEKTRFVQIIYGVETK